MYSPRASNPAVAASKSSAVPEGCGVAIPTNPQDLIAMIQRQHKKNINQISKQTDIVGRAQKQEQQRETYENKLMELEDFIYKPEGKERLSRQFEQLRMETEDELTMQLAMTERNKKKVDFKEQVRLEVEERLRKEELERQAKRKAAEDRRAAVVERLRKKAEEEERRRLEAEAALLRILQEDERRAQEARDRLATDRSNMVMEDDLSRLAEQDYKEQQERKLWERREKDKLAEVERALLAKDAEEAELRKARMAALEEKKAKLAELKRLQGLNGGGAGAASQAQAATSTREEAAKLDKQLRIQNKAKFVTKKIQSNANAASDAVVVSDPANLLSGKHGVPAEEAAAVGGGTEVRAAGAEVVASHPSKQGPEANQANAAFEQSVLGNDSEVALKKLQRDLMAEKRGLRLEQKQRMAGGAGAQDPAEIEYAKELRGKIADITFREGVVQRRLQQLLSASQSAAGGGGGSGGAATEGSAASGSAVVAAAASTAEIAALLGHDTTARHEETVVAGPADDQMPLYTRAEHLLREGQHLLKCLMEKSEGSSDHSASAAHMPAPSLGQTKKSFGKSFVFVRTDDASTQRRATLWVLETAQLAKDLDPKRDSGNYAEQLQALSGKVKIALSAATAGPEASAPLSSSPPAATPASAATPVPTPAAPAAPANPKMHASASTSNISDRRDGAKGEDMLSSASSSRLVAPPSPTRPAANPTPTIPEEVAPAAAQPVAPSSSRGGSEREASVSVPQDDSARQQEEQEEQEQGAGEEEQTINFEELPGWEECLTTSMASAAHHAAFYGYIEVLDCLCKYFDCFVMDKKGRTPLFYAALHNRLNCVASLVALDPQWIDVGDQNGDTSLHAAAIANGVEVLSFLLQCEANPDTANYAGLTPCHLARSRDALAVLCEAGAMPYCVDSKSRMPLWFACNEGRSDCAEFLCSKTPAAYLLWPDEEGETCLHRAAMGGHAQCVEALAAQLPGVEDLYTVNKKQHTAAHVASNAGVLKALYENGANLWMADPKGRMPLFTASFFGRADCIAFLLDVVSNSSSNSSSVKKGTGKGGGDAPAVVSAADFQGDTALHVACLCGHLRCVGLLLYFARCVKNRQGLTPDQLATKAGHAQIAQLVAHIEAKKEKEGLSSQEIFGCDFSMLSAVTLYYGARWAKLYDVSFDSVYYLDRATGQSQWERPEAYDEPAAEESRCDKARAVLHRFYSQYNPERLGSMNDILAAYRGRYTELFISLANKYKVQDLSMFAGVDLE